MDECSQRLQLGMQLPTALGPAVAVSELRTENTKSDLVLPLACRHFLVQQREESFHLGENQLSGPP